MMAEEFMNKQVVSDFMAKRFGDPDGAKVLMHEDATWFIPGYLPLSGTYANRDEIFSRYLGTHTNDFETITSEVTRLVGDGDCVVVEYLARGRTTKGRDYETTYYYVFTLADGKIKNVRQSFDTQYAQRVIYD